ncbi:SdrD B-like domain-containing protein [Kitasatospora sp. NPDC058397]|uniref:SdrD B-like domain-containing protein n=1 Tax=unclassified Kitasatospora TaxID=2633591 RepID=UPI0036630155
MRIHFRTGRIASVLALLAGSLLGSSVLAPPAQAAISFTKTVDKATASPGENVTYTLRYTCSITECTNGRIADTLPSNMQFVGWTPDPSSVDQAASTVPAAGAMGGAMDIRLKDLSPGTTATITVTMKYPNFTTPDGAASTNSATMTATGEPSQTASADTKAQVQPQYTVTKGIQTSSGDGRTVTYQFSACATDLVPNVDLDTSRLLDTLPPGAVVDTGRSPGWSQVAPGPNTWGYDIGEFRSGNGRGGCRLPGVLVVNYPEADFPDGTTSDNTVDLYGDPIGPDAERKLDTAGTTTGQFRPPATGVTVTASKVWRDGVTSGDINSFSLSATNTSGPATSLTMTDPGAGTTDGLYNWLFPQSLQLEPWNPTSIGLTLQYRLDGDPTWLTFSPSSPLDGSSTRRITFVQGAGDPARDELGIPAGRRLDGLRFTWDGPIPTGWSPGNSVQVIAQVVTPGHDGRPAPSPLTNCLDTTAGDGTSTSAANACASTTVTAATNLGAAKTTVAGELSAPGGMATFQVIPYNRSGRDLTRPLVLYDVLPAGVVYVEGSARPDPGYPDAKAPQSITVTPGPDGRQIVRMEWPPGAPDMMYLHDALAYRMLFDVQVASSIRSGELTNDIYVTVDRPTAPVACMFSGSDSGVPDLLDLNGNGDTSELMCHDSSRIQVDVPSVLRSYKEVMGDLDADYVSIGSATPGGRISYRMTVRNDSPDPVTDFIAYDRLPTPGDNYVLTQDAPRGSAWTPSLSQPITTSDPTVGIEYTTDPNPCVDAALVNRTGCNAGATWSSTFPGPGTATWFRVRRPGSLASGEAFTLTWPMVASVDAPDGEYAWNSFAFTATDAGGRQLLPAEPAKVGVAVKQIKPSDNALGDFVWQDVDGSGIQKPGDPGIAGVTVKLLDGNGQPVRDKNGKPVTTVTDQNGHYLFDHLPDGSYAVQFDLSTLPAGATVTKRGVGTDPAKDSDADPATGITQTVTLSGGQRDLDLDMGVILPTTPTGSPSPSPSPSPSSSPSPTSSPSPSPTSSPSPTPSASPSPTATPSGSTTPTAGPTHSASSSASGGTLPNTGSSAPDALIAALGALAVLGGVALCAMVYRRPGRHS